jgi:hypothetical protein
MPEIIEASPEISELAPAPDVLSEVRTYYELMRVDYARRIAEVEAFLGFAQDSEALGSRLHKVEAFLRIKG